MKGGGVPAIVGLWAFCFLVFGAMIQSGSLAAVSWKVWVVGGVTLAASIALSAYLLRPLD